jgi:hypothetical protein
VTGRTGQVADESLDLLDRVGRIATAAARQL